MHGPVVKPAVAGRVDPAKRVLQPLLIVSVGEILASLGAAAFFAIFRRMHRRNCLAQQIIELQGLDQIAVPDQRSIADLDVGK